MPHSGKITGSALSMPGSKPAQKPRRGTVSNRSLERGLELLRAFGPGATLLGNGDLAERTRLPKATVSRLTQTLVEAGYLEHDAGRKAYRLGVPVLSLAQAMRSGSTILQAAGPLIREFAQKHHINVGLAAADREEMVYLESVRYNQRVSLRNIVSGQRVPMELTSLGRAHLATLEQEAFNALMLSFERRGRAGWSRLHAEILDAVASVRERGYCAASWQPEVVALATPLPIPGHACVVLNFSVRTADSVQAVTRELSASLLALRDEILAEVERIEG
jgi:DNA-binding IclR family transcriptional regulator